MSTAASVSTTKHILITGTSRGLGLELVRQYLENESNVRVHATARNLGKAVELQALAKKHSNLSLIEVDISSPSSIQSALKSLPPISILINNAGILTSPGADSRSEDASVYADVYNTNCVGPAVVIQTLLPSLKEAAKLGLKPVVVNVSSTVESMTSSQTDDSNPSSTTESKTSLQPGDSNPSTTESKTSVQTGDFNPYMSLLPYRLSKAALNMLTVFNAQRYKDITFISVCPGWAATKLGKGCGGNPSLTPQSSVEAVRKVIANVTPAQSGQSLDRNGNVAGCPTKAATEHGKGCGVTPAQPGQACKGCGGITPAQFGQAACKGCGATPPQFGQVACKGCGATPAQFGATPPQFGQVACKGCGATPAQFGQVACCPTRAAELGKGCGGVTPAQPGQACKGCGATPPQFGQVACKGCGASPAQSGQACKGCGVTPPQFGQACKGCGATPPQFGQACCPTRAAEPGKGCAATPAHPGQACKGCGGVTPAQFGHAACKGCGATPAQFGQVPSCPTRASGQVPCCPTRAAELGKGCGVTPAQSGQVACCPAWAAELGKGCGGEHASHSSIFSRGGTHSHC